MRWVRSASLAACSWLLAATGYSQVARPPDRTLSLEQLVERALSQNQELLALRQSLAETQGLLRQAGMRPNPALGVSAASGDLLASRGERQFEVSYSHVVETAGKRDWLKVGAGIQVQIARFEIADRERRLRAAVKTRYFEALAARRNLAHVRELLALTRKSYELVQARVQAGEAALLEQGLLRVELGRLESDETLIASELERTLIGLGVLVGEDLGGELAEHDLASRLPLQLDPAQLLAQALESRPDLQALRSREHLAEAELNLARAQAIPDLVLTGRFAHVQTRLDAYGFAHIGGPLAPLRDKDNLLSAGISVSLPLRNRNQGNIEAALARQRAARLQRQALERSVRQDVLSAVSRCQTARQAMSTFVQRVLPEAAANLRMIRGAYELGELRLLDVIAEQRKLLEVQRALDALFREANVAAVELEQALGAPLP